MKPYKAIVAMSRNRAIGCGGAIPWHLPEDFRWFKKITMGHILLMGRKTYESIGRPLPGRETIVLSRTQAEITGVRVIHGVGELALPQDGRSVFVCGGGEIYRMLVPECHELFVSHVKREVIGDAFFPEFEAAFRAEETLHDDADFTLIRYAAKTV